MWRIKEFIKFKFINNGFLVKFNYKYFNRVNLIDDNGIFYLAEFLE